MSNIEYEISYFIVHKSTITPTLDDRTPEKTYKSAVLPRTGDYLEIDGGISLVIAVEFDYKNEFSPNVYLKPVGGFAAFEKILFSA